MTDADPPPKQAYSPPTLVTYGDVAKLTQATKFFGKINDGGKGFKQRTN